MGLPSEFASRNDPAGSQDGKVKLHQHFLGRSDKTEKTEQATTDFEVDTLVSRRMKKHVLKLSLGSFQECT